MGGKKLRCYGVRPHLNPLPGGEEVASLPPFWIPVRYRGSGCALRGNDEFRGNGVVAWYSESAWRILPRPTPAPAGDKPPHYISPVPTPLDSGLRRSECGLVRRVGMADSAAPHTGPSGGQAPALHFSTSPSLWIPAPYRGTGQALRWNDEMSGESLSRIGVREVLPCRYEAGPGLESIRSWIRV